MASAFLHGRSVRRPGIVCRLIYGVFAFILFAVLALFVFFDMLSELESVQGKYTSLIAFFHVMLEAPTRIYEVLPIAVLISAIYVF